MIDILIKKSQVIENKISFNTNKPDINLTNIIYIIQKNDIVYIGNTTGSIQKYIEDKFTQYHASHYYTEQIKTKDANNYLAELILKFQPINNKNLPANDKYISNNMAKQNYFISKVDFKKSYKEYGGIKYRSALYMEKIIFDDIYGISQKYHKDMPKIGTLINIQLDIDKIGFNYSQYHQEYKSFLNNEGNSVEQITHVKLSAKEEYSKILKLREQAYEVIQLIDSENFIVVNNKKEKKHLNVNDHKYFSQNTYSKQSWLRAPSDYDIDELKQQSFQKNNNA